MTPSKCKMRDYFLFCLAFLMILSRDTSFYDFPCPEVKGWLSIQPKG